MKKGLKTLLVVGGIYAIYKLVNKGKAVQDLTAQVAAVKVKEIKPLTTTLLLGISVANPNNYTYNLRAITGLIKVLNTSIATVAYAPGEAAVSIAPLATTQIILPVTISNLSAGSVLYQLFTKATPKILISHDLELRAEGLSIPLKGDTTIVNPLVKTGVAGSKVTLDFATNEQLVEFMARVDVKEAVKPKIVFSKN